MWSALSAARAVSIAGKAGEIDITVVSPEPRLHVRPRLYERVFQDMAPDIAPLLAAVGVRHFAGTVETVNTSRHEIEVKSNSAEFATLAYDRFILATGSRLFFPDIPGLAEHSFNVDQLPNAVALDSHIRALGMKRETAARNTIVVAGGGFTGIETVLEMPQRLREALGANAKIRVVVLEQAPTIGPDLGPGPRPVIEQALAECGIEVMTSTAAAAIDAEGVLTARGARIESNTVIWTAGARAHPLAAQIGAEHDRFGRVPADRHLRAAGVEDVFVSGDVAMAATDDLGHIAAMSCQHALSLGRVSGYNAAAELVGLPMHPYSQPKYVTCLDLGPWGAVYTEGWERQVRVQGQQAKAIKRAINTQLIYPPQADRDAAFGVATPGYGIAT